MQARYYEKIPGTNNLRCLLCSHRCVIAPEKKGFCRSRLNEGGVLYTLNYASASAVNVDPIEKKPLYHFLPSTSIVSIGTNYCNFSCKFCQNFEISQFKTTSIQLSPQKLLELIKSGDNCRSLAFTYNEPVIWYEYVYDASEFIKKNNFKTVLVTNGDISAEAFTELAPFIDAMNVDLKAFDKKIYTEICSGSLEAVCATIESAFKRGIIVEVTNLIIPGLNDSDGMLNALIDFVASVSADIPLHFSKYHPAYLMNYPATSLALLNKAYSMAVKKLKYVYLGNISDSEKSSTYCPACKKKIIKRNNYACEPSGINSKGECLFCGEKIYGNFYNCNN
jgi:pyruvate formate lyase activating enzyme